MPSAFTTTSESDAPSATHSSPGFVGCHASADGDDSGAPPVHECSACKRSLAADAFNRTQLVKGAGKQRCRECVEAAEKATAGEKTARDEAAITESVTQSVTASVTETVTASVTESVTESVTASVTESVTAQLTAQLTALAAERDAALEKNKRNVEKAKANLTKLSAERNELKDQLAAKVSEAAALRESVEQAGKAEGAAAAAGRAAEAEAKAEAEEMVRLEAEVAVRARAEAEAAAEEAWSSGAWRTPSSLPWDLIEALQAEMARRFRLFCDLPNPCAGAARAFCMFVVAATFMSPI